MRRERGGEKERGTRRERKEERKRERERDKTVHGKEGRSGYLAFPVSLGLEPHFIFTGIPSCRKYYYFL